MDPHLLDLVWAIYQETGSHDYIHVVSAYRSPTTNEMLRARSSGVAKNSQHRLGKAMDWFVTDVPLSKLREIAMKMQGGGVGYYPRSGSPFVHTDTGNVRAWPRMSREQLIALFPNGNTLHLPADGQPLPGYAEAVARRNAMGDSALAYLETKPSTIQVADRTGTDATTTGWLKHVFTGNDQSDDQGDDDTADQTPQPQPAHQNVVLASAETDPTNADSTDARVPRARPAAETDAAAEPQPVVVASADAGVTDMLVLPALGDGSGMALNPEDFGIGAQTIRVRASSQDAIAGLLSPQDAAQPARPPKPVQLAYAPTADEPSAVSDADRAILAAFAAVDRSDAGNPPDPMLVAALTREARGGSLTAERPTVVADNTQGGTAGRAPGVVVAASDLPAYDGDEDELLDLIDAAQPADPQVANLAMPKPAAAGGLFVAPGAASEVADLRGEAGPPVNRFTPAVQARRKDNQGFFTKLFASLIE